MSYFKKYTSTKPYEDEEICNYLISLLPKSPSKLDSYEYIINKQGKINANIDLDNLKKILNDKLSYYSSMLDEPLKKIMKVYDLPEEKLWIVKRLLFLTTKMIIGKFIVTFTDTQLSKFTMNKLSKNFKNKQFVNFLENEIDNVFKLHPNYLRCNGKQFIDTPIFNYMLAEWRDKELEDNAKLLGIKALDSAITAIVSNAVPLPGSSILAIPLKMAMTYCGFKFGQIGSLSNIAVDLNGNAISMGFILTPTGFRITNTLLYCFKPNGKLIAVPLKDPPERAYKLTVQDAKQILKDSINDKENNFDSIKQEVEKHDARAREAAYSI